VESSEQIVYSIQRISPVFPCRSEGDSLQCTFTLTPALGKPAKFTAPPTSGVEVVDETVLLMFTFQLQVDLLLAFAVGVSIGVRDVTSPE
jgi:hypothetical protein